MTLSLSSIFQPLNDFFLEQFKTPDASQLSFRFDRFGSIVSDDDFIPDENPDLGPSSALAREKFSDLVNRVPSDEGDGVNIVLTQNRIDDTYMSRLLSPSIPFLPTGVDDITKQSIIDTFSQMKAKAVQTFEEIRLTSLQGVPLQYKPALATPDDWFDSTKNTSWTDHEIHISEPAAVAPPDPKSTRLWRMRVSPEAVSSMIGAAADNAAPVAAADPGIAQDSVSLVAAGQFVTAKPMIANSFKLASFKHQAALGFASPAVAPAATFKAAHAFALDPSIVLATAAVAEAHEDTGAVKVIPNFEKLKVARAFDIDKRLVVSHALGEAAPTETVTTNEMTIAFQYCLVHIDRPWMATALITPGSWCVPGVTKGSVTTPGAGNLPLLPIGFVAIRHLTIHANWSADDLVKANDATDLGPFKVDSGIVNDRLGHPGLQIVGWLLQELPALPPQELN